MKGAEEALQRALPFMPRRPTSTTRSRRVALPELLPDPAGCRCGSSEPLLWEEVLAGGAVPER